MRIVVFPLARMVWMAASVALFAAFVLAALRFPALLAVVVLACLWHARRSQGAGTSHGSAAQASLADLARAGLLNTNSGLILGRASFAVRPPRGQALRLLWFGRCPAPVAVRLCLAAFWSGRDDGLVRLPRHVHAATFAGTGRGKGVGAVIPNALAYAFSIVVIDMKSEIFHATAQVRRRKGHEIVVLDPFGLSGEKTSVLNALDFIDHRSLGFLDQCRVLADSLVVVAGTEPDPHWNAWARLVITAFIAFVCATVATPEKRNLKSVAALLSSRHKYNESIRLMQEQDGFFGVLRELGHKLTWLEGEELGSVLSTVQRHLEWTSSPAVASVFAGRSTFHPLSLKNGKMSVYLILPPDKLTTLAGLMRMWVGTILSVVTQGTPDERNPILFLLDEFGHLGHMQSIEDAVTLLRGYGIRLWFIWQSIGQVRKNFGDRAQIVLDNIDTQQYFGISCFESAKAISERGGDATILTRSLNRSRSRSTPERGVEGGSVSESDSLTLSPHGRALYRPDEVIRLPDDTAILYHKNMPMIRLKLLRYYEAPEFRKGRAGESRACGLCGLLAGLVFLAASLLLAAGLLLAPAPAPVPIPPSPGFDRHGRAFDAPYPPPYAPPAYPYPARRGSPGMGRFHPRNPVR